MRTKVFLFLGIGLLILGGALIFHFLSLGTLRIIACDVGQGDGLLIITPSGKQIVVDGGPGNKMVGCLSNNMPFWDRTVEFVLNTHPQEDHLEGLIGVLENYRVKTVAASGIEAETGFFETWKKDLAIEQARSYKPKAGDKLILDRGKSGEVTMEILWPPEYKYNLWSLEAPKDSNETSVVFRLSYGQFCGYFTGDIPKEILETLIDKQCELLKIAHHGSKTGTNEKILGSAKPKATIIQAGKNNRYGHPTKEVLELLTNKNVQLLRTDIDGTIEIVVKGDRLRIKNGK